MKIRFSDCCCCFFRKRRSVVHSPRESLDQSLLAAGVAALPSMDYDSFTEGKLHPYYEVSVTKYFIALHDQA